MMIVLYDRMIVLYDRMIDLYDRMIVLYDWIGISFIWLALCSWSHPRELGQFYVSFKPQLFSDILRLSRGKYS